MVLGGSATGPVCRLLYTSRRSQYSPGGGQRNVHILQGVPSLDHSGGSHGACGAQEINQVTPP